MTEVHIVKVFVDAEGKFGDPASIIFDAEHTLSTASRQELTRRIGHAETVFIDNLPEHRVSIFNPQQEVKFAGSPIVGTAWLLDRQTGASRTIIHCLGGDVQAWHEDKITWIQASLAMMPPWKFMQLATPEAIVNFSKEAAKNLEHTFIWAWLDETAGLVRARTFAADWEIPEAEVNGSGSMILAAKHGKKLMILHGQGSVIYAEPADNNHVNVGGEVIADSVINL